jgi:pyruvate ferredoxin oxidoreductase beta subunit
MEGNLLKIGKNRVPLEEFVAEGHSFCTGCGEALALRLACKALGRNVIIGNATGCIEICT